MRARTPDMEDIEEEWIITYKRNGPGWIICSLIGRNSRKLKPHFDFRGLF